MITERVGPGNDPAPNPTESSRASSPFVLCRVGDRANEIREARDYIAKAGYRTLAGELPEKTGHRRASDEGRAPTEVDYPSLRAKAERLAQSIIDVTRSPT